jgi:mRNA-degrading endonuclease RelE of RelBE toxin-antitoxin system
VAYTYTTTRHFDKAFQKLTRKNKALRYRVLDKIAEIVDNPKMGVPKGHELKGLRGVHIDPFVIIYVLVEDKIVFLHFDHHDKIYNASAIFTPAQMTELRDRFGGFED